jgi:hypothetical protein
MERRDNVPQRLADSEHDHLKLDIRDFTLCVINRKPDMILMGKQRFRSTKAFRHPRPAFHRLYCSDKLDYIQFSEVP